MNNNLKNKDNILIIGASGRVGKEIFKVCKNHIDTYDTFGTYYSDNQPDLYHLDIRNESEIEKFFKKIQPSILIHAAGMIHPLQCEEKKDLAWSINVTGTKNIVDCCKKYNCKLVYISTDYVFDGKNNPYAEFAITNPLNQYGMTKLESEKLISSLNDYLIIRSAWINDIHKNSKSFVMQVLNSLKNRQKFYAPDDQFGNPTLSVNLAEIIFELISKNQQGIFHVTGSTYIDRYNFALKIAKVFSLDENLIQKISTSELNQQIKRPLKIQMNLKKLKSVISTKILSLEDQLNYMKQTSDNMNS